MKRFLRLAIVLFACIFLFVACGDNSSNDDLANLGPAEKFERNFEKEAQNLPNFSVNVEEDKDFKVDGIPEEVVWLTASMPDFGSSMVKKGGVFHNWISHFPENYRFIGPQGNHEHREYMRTSTTPMWLSGETKEFFPLTCTHWAFGADNQTVYYKLLEEVKWSDGTPCTADDYVWAWKMYCDPNLDDPWYNTYGKKSEVIKINDYCIAVKWLETDKLTKYELLDKTQWMPAQKKFFNNGKLYKNWHIDFNWKYAPTIGPYVLDEDKTKKGEIFVLKKVENWWGNSVDYLKSMANFDTLEFKVITGGPEIVKEYFYKGELDVFSLTQAQYWNEAATNSNVTNGYIDRFIFNFSPRASMRGICFNINHPFFMTRKARYAMYYALDIQGMIDNVLQGEYKRYHNIGLGQIWAGYDFNDHTIRKPDFDPVKAGELLAEAGYDKFAADGIRVNAEGIRASFELLYDSPILTERFSYLKEQAKKAGVEIELVINQQGWIPLVFAKDFQAVFLSFSFKYLPDPHELFNSKDGKRADSLNIFGYGTDEMDTLLDISRDESLSLADRAENNKMIEQLVHKESLVIPDYYTDYSRLATWKWLKFPAWANKKYDQSALSDVIWSYAWIDQDIKKEINEARDAGKTFEPKIWKLSTRYIED